MRRTGAGKKPSPLKCLIPQIEEKRGITERGGESPRLKASLILTRGEGEKGTGGRGRPESGKLEDVFILDEGRK